MNNKKIFTAGLIGVAALTAGLAYAQSAHVDLSTYYAFPGQKVEVGGQGFNANANVKISAADSEHSATTSGNGNFSGVNLSVPTNTAAANLAVNATDGAKNASASLTLARYYPNVQPSGWYLPPGSPINFSGRGFAPNEKISVSARGQNLGEIQANETGSFTSTNFSLPYSQGPISFMFSGQTSHASINIIIKTATDKPYIVLNNYYLASGATFEIKGFAFGAGETVSLNFGGLPIGQVSANSQGKFVIQATVPALSQGPHNLTATGASSGLVAQTGFTIAP